MLRIFGIGVRSLGVWSIVLAGGLAIAAAESKDRYVLGGGLQMGYTDGMNGFPWPALAKDPLHNNNRAGFYVSQTRLAGSLVFDSTFAVKAVWNAIYNDLQEVYVSKRWGDYSVRAGKFRGAGLKTMTGEDEFERDLLNAPRYARLWAYFARTFNGRDFGLEIGRDFLGGDLRNRLFIRNASLQNVINDEPSFNIGDPTQALGFDYAIDWRISPFTVWGAHIGAVASRGWDDFVGDHEGWEAQYWFKSNSVVDASLNHGLDVGRFHLSNEGMIMLLRDQPHPVDSGATQFWGLSSLVRFDHSARWTSLFRYEFCDPTDGSIPNDALHMFTLGAVFRPSPSDYSGMKVTTQYVRAYEENLANLVSNDLFNCQFQMTF